VGIGDGVPEAGAGTVGKPPGIAGGSAGQCLPAQGAEINEVRSSAGRPIGAAGCSHGWSVKTVLRPDAEPVESIYSRSSFRPGGATGLLRV
jgi:hypothetical protein